MPVSSLGNRLRGSFRVASLTVAGVVAIGFFLASGVAPATAAPALNAYVSEPFVQGPSVTGVQLETFDSNCPATWWSTGSNPGTMTGTCSSVNGNIYGGASTTSGVPTRGGGLPQTKYAAAFNGASVTVTLNHAASYLGFQWSAGDAANRLTLYSGATVVATFTTQDLMAMLYNDDMGAWSANDYLINPARNQWVGEPFAYLHLVGVGGLTFDSFTITQPRFGFEFDNFSLSDSTVTVDPLTTIAIGDETPPDANRDGVDDTTEDADGDGIADPFEDVNGDGVADVLEDSNGNGTNDYIDRIMLANTGFDPWPALSSGVILLGIGFALILLRRRSRA